MALQLRVCPATPQLLYFTWKVLAGIILDTYVLIVVQSLRCLYISTSSCIRAASTAAPTACLGPVAKARFGTAIKSSTLRTAAVPGYELPTANFFFFFAYPIYYLHPSSSLSLLPTRNSDPGSHSRLFSPLPATVNCTAAAVEALPVYQGI